MSGHQGGGYHGPHHNGRERGLRRPHHPQPDGLDDVVNGMSGMRPFPADVYGSPVPPPNADGWSSGRNEFDRGQTQPRFPPQRPPDFGPGVGQQYYSARDRAPPQYHTPAQARLSAKAVEFTPMALDVSAAEFVPRNMARNTSQWASNVVHHQQHMILDPFKEVDGGVNALVYSPGKFDQIAVHMGNVLNEADLTKDILQKCLDLIIRTCLTESNFSYTGTRLLNYLAANVKPNEDFSFEAMVLEECPNLLGNRRSDDTQNLRALAMFMADLFLQFEMNSTDPRWTATQISYCVASLLTELTSTTNRNEIANLKQLFQILKMCGDVLLEKERLLTEGEGSSKAPGFLEPLVAHVKEVCQMDQSNGIPLYITEMMTNFVKRRDSTWDQEPNPNQRKQPRDSAPSHASYEPAMLQAPEFNGVCEFTPEEMRFMSEQMGEEYDPNEEVDSDAEPEMDPEIEAAFEEFLEAQQSKS